MPISVAGSGAITGTTTINGLTMPSDAIAPGLILINTQNLSNTTSVIFSNCFSSVYDNYLLTSYGVQSGGSNVTTTMQFRSNGIVTTSGYIYSQNANGTVTQYSGQSNIYFAVFNGEYGASTADIYAPALARQTNVISRSTWSNTGTTPMIWTVGGTLRDITVYDSLVINFSTTLTNGVMSIYGYRK